MTRREANTITRYSARKAEDRRDVCGIHSVKVLAPDSFMSSGAPFNGSSISEPDPHTLGSVVVADN